MDIAVTTFAFVFGIAVGVVIGATIMRGSAEKMEKMAREVSDSSSDLCASHKKMREKVSTIVDGLVFKLDDWIEVEHHLIRSGNKDGGAAVNKIRKEILAVLKKAFNISEEIT